MRGLSNRLPCERTCAIGLALSNDVVDVGRGEEIEADTLEDEWHSHLLDYTSVKHRNKVAAFLKHSHKNLLDLAQKMLNFVASDGSDQPTTTRLARKYVTLSLGLPEATTALSPDSISGQDVQTELKRPIRSWRKIRRRRSRSRLQAT